MANMFNEDGTYNKTEWKAGDRITAVKLNKIELSLEAINNNDIDRHVEADTRLDVLEERMANTPDNERIDALEDMIKDNKDAAELGDYEINSRMDFLEADMKGMVSEVEVDLNGLHDKDEELSEQLAYIVINVKNEGVKGNGYDDDSTSLQNVINKYNEGCFIFFPKGTYNLDSDIINPENKPINILMSPGVEFLGNGRMLTSETNSFHQHRGQYFISRPRASDTEQGHSTLTAEVVPEADFKGNAVAGFFGAKGKTGGVPTSGVWAQNILATCDEGYKGAVRAIEVDLENYSDNVNLFYGLTFWGNGTKNIDGCILIARTNFPTSWYDIGQEIRHSKQGLFINQCEKGIRVRNIGDVMIEGISIENVQSKSIQIQPKLINDEKCIDVNNIGDGTPIWYITNNGKASFKGISLDGEMIIKHNSYILPMSQQTINANSVTEGAIHLPSGHGYIQGDTIIATPIGDPGAGVVWSAYINSNNQVMIRFTNSTTIQRTINAINWRIDLFKH